jgi:hypothetical protein
LIEALVRRSDWEQHRSGRVSTTFIDGVDRCIGNGIMFTDNTTLASAVRGGGGVVTTAAPAEPHDYLNEVGALGALLDPPHNRGT